MFVGEVFWGAFMKIAGQFESLFLMDPQKQHLIKVDICLNQVTQIAIE